MVKSYNGETYFIPKAFEEACRADERAKTIDEFVKRLFANDVIDKSVVRRVAEQLREHNND